MCLVFWVLYCSAEFSIFSYSQLFFCLWVVVKRLFFIPQCRIQEGHTPLCKELFCHRFTQIMAFLRFFNIWWKVSICIFWTTFQIRIYIQWIAHTLWWYWENCFKMHIHHYANSYDCLIWLFHSLFCWLKTHI